MISDHETHEDTFDVHQGMTLVTTFFLTHRSNESEGRFYIRGGPWSYERSC